MRTGTGATRETVSQAWSPVLAAAGVEGQELGRQILALAHQVAVHSLSGPLTDPGREPEEKAVLARRLFEVHEQIAVDRELREALAPSRRTRTEARVRLAEAVFGVHISAPAMSLLRWCVRHRAEGGPLRNLRRVVELAAAMRHRTIADVVTAIPMTTAQESRLRTILERRLGTSIDLNCEVDPEVIGGARIMIRNHVLDHTVRGAVAELRTRLAG